LQIFAFDFNLRRYTAGNTTAAIGKGFAIGSACLVGRGLHSSTSQLNLSRF
jgi:Na+/H+-translocating membrane pyrophosphatase